MQSDVPTLSNALALVGLGFAFAPGAPVVQAVEAQVHSGRLTVILGPNGAGKSVLLSLMAGLRRPTHGSVHLAGRPLAAWPGLELAKRLAWVPHQTQGGEDFSVAEMVGLGRLAQHEAASFTHQAVGRALAQMDLAELAHRPVGALSGGQRRRLMVARALAQLDGTPQGVLLLDEPDANLDPAQAVFLFQKLRLLAAGGLTVVAVVHDLHLAEAFADDAWLMREGRLLAAGDAKDVLTQKNLTSTYGVKVRPGEGWVVG